VVKQSRASTIRSGHEAGEGAREVQGANGAGGDEIPGGKKGSAGGEDPFSLRGQGSPPASASGTGHERGRDTGFVGWDKAAGRRPTSFSQHRRRWAGARLPAGLSHPTRSERGPGRRDGTLSREDVVRLGPILAGQCPAAAVVGARAFEGDHCTKNALTFAGLCLGPSSRTSVCWSFKILPSASSTTR